MRLWKDCRLYRSLSVGGGGPTVRSRRAARFRLSRLGGLTDLATWLSGEFGGLFRRRARLAADIAVSGAGIAVNEHVNGHAAEQEQHDRNGADPHDAHRR
jgi:hypothetical protein